MAINTSYFNSSSFLNNIYGSARTSNSSGSNLADLYNTPIFNRVNIYGKNTAATLQSNVHDFLSGAKLSAYELKTSLNSMLGKKMISSFSKTAVSTNNNLLSIKSAEANKLSGSLNTNIQIIQVAKEGQNAIYKINGGEQVESKTNDIDIGNGITATLKAPGTAEVTIGRNNDNAVSDIKKMVDSFNDLLATAEVNRSDRRTDALYNQLVNASKVYSQALSRVGIDVTTSGYMKIDEAKLKTAVENGNLETFMTENNGRNYGFASRLQNIAGRVDNNPSAYVTIAYDRQNTIDLNAYQSMQYSKYENVGLFLNMVI